MSADGHGLRPGVSAGDSKELRTIDHAVVWAFGVAKDLKPGTISRSWVAKFIKRSEIYVQRNSVLSKTIKNELKTMSKNTDLFEHLLRSYPSRLAAVRAAKGKATDY